VKPGEPVVSLIIPCFNGARFLPEALESVRAQTYRRWEIIVVDDGSTDHSAAVAGSYPDVRCLRQSNRGLGASRNTGIAAAGGEFLVFLDVDDRLLPQAFEVGLEQLSRSPDNAFVSGHVHLISEKGEWLETPADKCITSDHYQTLLRYCYIWTTAPVMFRTSAVRAIGGYSDDFHGAADWDLLLRLTRLFPVSCHEHVVAEYRIHDAQMTKDLAHMLSDCLRCLRRQSPYASADPALQVALDAGLAGVRRYYGDPLKQQMKSDLSAGSLRKAAAAAIALVRHHPRALLEAVRSGSDASKL
jgi:glycosyltransferase involved in cell wall biosynthesis